MKKKRVYMIVLAVLCVLLAVGFSLAAVCIYREGAALRAEDPLAAIYTTKNVSAAFRFLAPLLIVTAVMAVVGLFLGIRDERADRPVKLKNRSSHARVGVKNSCPPAGTRIKASGSQEQNGIKSSGSLAEGKMRKSSSFAGAGKWQAVLIAAAVVFIVLGIFNGSMQDVLVKASAICTECIGMG